MAILRNQRWESFARHVASGMSQAEAWRVDRPNSRASSKTSHERASQLAARPEVRERIAELAKAAESRAVASSRELQEFLTRVIRTPVGAVNSLSDLAQEVESIGRKSRRIKMPSKLDAIDRLAKLLGYYVAERMEQTVRVTGAEALSDDELEKIARGD